MLIWNSLLLLLSWKINHAAKNKKSVLTGFDDTELKLLHGHPNDDQEWIQPRNIKKRKIIKYENWIWTLSEYIYDYIRILHRSDYAKPAVENFNLKN